MMILPFTLSFARIAIIINPTNATTGGAICAIASFALPALDITPWKSKNCTNVYGLSWMSVAFFSPISAIKRPIPAGIDFLRHSGIATAIYFLRPVTERIRNTRPDTNTITRPAW